MNPCSLQGYIYGQKETSWLLTFCRMSQIWIIMKTRMKKVIQNLKICMFGCPQKEEKIMKRKMCLLIKELKATLWYSKYPSVLILLNFNVYKNLKPFTAYIETIVQVFPFSFYHIWMLIKSRLAIGLYYVYVFQKYTCDFSTVYRQNLLFLFHIFTVIMLSCLLFLAENFVYQNGGRE